MPKRPPTLNTRGKRSGPRGWAKTSRKSRRARGYGPDWDRLRKQVLTDEPLCRACRVEEVSTVATTVDHIKPKHLGGTDERSNLQPLCDGHHRAKTAAEAAAARSTSPFR